MTGSQRSFTMRSVIWAAILPTLVFSIGEGAIVPIIPIAANNLGADLAVAGLVTAMLTVGILLGDIPGGWVIMVIGERVAMIYASMLSIIGLIIAAFAPNPAVLGLGILLVGVATAVFALARHAFMTSFVPIRYRARALSSLGGSFRLGFFIGPFISAGAIHLTGNTQSVFWIHIVACLGVIVILMLMPDPTAAFGAAPTRRGKQTAAELAEQTPSGLLHTIVENHGVLLRIGMGTALLGALRTSRQVILPLWAVSIGISDANTALIIGLLGAIDFSLFYSSGQIMDRFGRLWGALPVTIGLGLGHLVLALSLGLPEKFLWFIIAAVIMSIASGLGTGIFMTLGADLADRSNPAPFLGAFRFTGDVGNAAAPLVIAGLTAAVSLAFSSGVLGIVGLFGAGILGRYIPRYIPHIRK